MKKDKKIKFITILLFLSIILNIYLYNSKKKEDNVHYMIDRLASSIYKNDISNMEDILVEGYDKEHWKEIISQLNAKHIESDMKNSYDFLKSYGTLIILELDKETYIVNIYPGTNGNLYIDDILTIDESKRKGIIPN